MDFKHEDSVMRHEVWTPQLLVGGADVTAFVTSEFHVSVQAGNARVLQFSCGLGTGGFSMQPADDLGKTVVLKINGTKVFTGTLSNFGANLDEGIVNYDCSDNYASSYARMAQKFEDSPQLQSKWNKHLLGDKKDATDEEKYRAYLLQNDLIYSIAADGSDLLTRKTAAAAISAGQQVKAFDESNILMGHGDVSYSTDVGSNSGTASLPVNQLVYEIAFRYPVAHELKLSVHWEDPYPAMTSNVQIPAHVYAGQSGFFSGVYHATKAGFMGAVNGLGYKILGTHFVPPKKTGLMETGASISNSELLMSQATAVLGHRWVTYQTEYRTLVIQNKLGIAAHGLHSEKRTITVQALENIFNIDEWSRWNAPGPDLTGNGSNTHAPGWHSRALYNLMQFDPSAYAGSTRAQDPALLEAANENFSVQDACDLAVDMAKKELLENQVSTMGAKGGIATTTLRFRVSFFDLPSPNVGWPATYNTSRWEARGIVNAMDLIFSLDGSAIADVTLTSITPPNASVPSDINSVIPLAQRASEQYLTSYDDTYIHNPITGLMESTLRPQDRGPKKAGASTSDPQAAPKVWTGGVPMGTYCWAFDSWATLGKAPGTPTEELPSGAYLDFKAGSRNDDTDIPTNTWIIRTPPLPKPEDTIYIKAPQFFECNNLAPDPFIYKQPV